MIDSFSKVLYCRFLRQIIFCFEKAVLSLVTSVGTKKKFSVLMRNRTSDLRISFSDALTLNYRDCTVSEVYYEVHMTSQASCILLGSAVSIASCL